MIMYADGTTLFCDSNDSNILEETQWLNARQFFTSITCVYMLWSGKSSSELCFAIQYCT